MFNTRLIIHILGLLVAISGVLMLFAIPFSLYYGTDDLYPILFSALGITLSGFLVWFGTRKGKSKEIKKRDAYLVVTFGWIVMSLAGAIPYVASGYIPSFTDAFFESMSGFTTTGASILNDIEALPEGLLFWRSMTHWIGGMGIIVLTIAILPLLGIGGMQLFAAEVPGPTPDKLTPRIKETAKRLWIIYVALTLLETGLLMFGEMNFFEAICHSMATLSTGGFSTRQASLGAFSPYIQYVVIVFMFIAGMNFTLTYFAMRGRPKLVWKNEEFRTYFILVIFLIGLVSAIVFVSQDVTAEKAFRDSAFQVVSILTTTGFGSADYTTWTPFLTLLFFVLMFSGASAGSTSGSIKIVRFLVVFKNSFLELKRQIHPKAIIPVRFNGRSVSQEVVSKILAFFLLFLILFVVGSFVMSLIGLDFETSVGSVAATLGNIGPGIGKVGPAYNFFEIPATGKWFLSFLMLLGRLELFTVLMLFTPFFYREK
jgi:trk system potassium uptake protein TrkH